MLPQGFTQEIKWAVENLQKSHSFPERSEDGREYKR
jgi:hypothetical protein